MSLFAEAQAALDGALKKAAVPVAALTFEEQLKVAEVRALLVIARELRMARMEGVNPTYSEVG